MNQNKPITIGIIGLGHIGGSLGLVLKKHTNHRICGLSKSDDTNHKALRRGCVDEIARSPKEIAQKSDILFICVPLTATKEILEHIAPHVSSKTIITDIGSVKAPIVEMAQCILPHPNVFVGGHPMAGTENSGIDHADETILAHARWVLTPTKTTDQRAIHVLEKVLTNASFRIVFRTPETHDRHAAVISHIPAILSALSVHAVPQKDIGTIATLAATGFASTTRLAQTNPDRNTEYVMFNQDHITSSLAQLIDQMSQLQQCLKANDQKSIYAFFKKAQSMRSHILNHKTL